MRSIAGPLALLFFLPRALGIGMGQRGGKRRVHQGEWTSQGPAFRSLGTLFARFLTFPAVSDVDVRGST